MEEEEEEEEEGEGEGEGEGEERQLELDPILGEIEEEEEEGEGEGEGECGGGWNDHAVKMTMSGREEGKEEGEVAERVRPVTGRTMSAHEVLEEVSLCERV